MKEKPKKSYNNIPIDTDMEAYRSGYMTQGDEFVAIIYTIPASEKLADRLKFLRDMNNPPAWQVRDMGDELQIYYEAEADSCHFPVYKKAEGEIYEEAMKDIVRFINRAA